MLFQSNELQNHRNLLIQSVVKGPESAIMPHCIIIIICTVMSVLVFCPF